MKYRTKNLNIDQHDPHLKQLEMQQPSIKKLPAHFWKRNPMCQKGCLCVCQEYLVDLFFLKIYSVIYRFWHNRPVRENFKYWTLNVLIQLQWFSRQSWSVDADTTQQGYIASRLKSSLQKIYGRHQDLVDRYDIFISQMTMDLLFFKQICFFTLSLPRLLHDLIAYMSYTVDVLRKLLALRQYPRFFVGFVLLIFLAFLCCPVLSSVFWCALRCSHKNDVPFVFTSCCMYDEWCLIFYICVCMRIMAFNTPSLYE